MSEAHSSERDLLYRSSHRSGARRCDCEHSLGKLWVLQGTPPDFFKAESGCTEVKQTF